MPTLKLTGPLHIMKVYDKVDLPLVQVVAPVGVRVRIEPETSFCVRDAKIHFPG